MPDREFVRSWLNRVHHDLVKRVLWAARDYRALGQTPPPGGLITQCINDEGQAVSGLECWQTLRSDAPPHLQLDDFEGALRYSLLAASRDDLGGVLALEAAFERLSTHVNSTPD